MKPRGPLMIEHRLIERMLGVIKDRIAEIDRGRDPDPVFIDTAVDFIRTYADRTHHGKEEDILFRRLADKPMSAEYRRQMSELVEEHRYGRQLVGELSAAKADFLEDRSGALDRIRDRLRSLVDFYPAHIQKEDRIFFPGTEGYFAPEELDAMLREFWEFDRKMIHEKYEGLVRGLTAGGNRPS